MLYFLCLYEHLFTTPPATSTSDIDLLINFDTTKTLFELADIQYDFENILGRKVDLVMQNSVKKQLQPFIDRDLVTVYAKS